MKKWLSTPIILVLACLTLACANRPTQAPVPGSTDSLDAWSYRIITDAGASVHSIKIWELCTAASFPATVAVDNVTEKCDPTNGPFPMQFKPVLNDAINALNIAAIAGQAYHSGASKDTNGLTVAVNNLSGSVTKLMSSIGGKK